MEGIKEAIEYVVGLSQPNYAEHEGEKWADKPMYRIHHELPKANALQMCTLDSLVGYIKSNTDKMDKHMLIHVQSPTKVVLMSELDVDRCREKLVEVNAMLPQFTFDTYYPAESFVINVMSKFMDNDDKEQILKYAGTIETGTIAKYGDDGVSQKATIQQTCTSKAEAIIPNPVHLAPYRTFLEVEQPSSDFIFRARDDAREPQFALFEADGGAWKLEAMNLVAAYLKDAIQELHIEQDITFTVIS